MRTLSTIQIESYKEQFTNLLLLAIFGVVLVYASLLLSLTFTAVKKRENLKAVRILTTTLSSLERSYSTELAVVRGDTMNKLTLASAEKTSFAVRKDPISTLTLLYER